MTQSSLYIYFTFGKHYKSMRKNILSCLKRMQQYTWCGCGANSKDKVTHVSLTLLLRYLLQALHTTSRGCCLALHYSPSVLILCPGDLFWCTCLCIFGAPLLYTLLFSLCMYFLLLSAVVILFSLVLIHLCILFLRMPYFSSFLSLSSLHVTSSSSYLCLFSPHAYITRPYTPSSPSSPQPSATTGIPAPPPCLSVPPAPPLGLAAAPFTHSLCVPTAVSQTDASPPLLTRPHRHGAAASQSQLYLPHAPRCSALQIDAPFRLSALSAPPVPLLS